MRVAGAMRATLPPVSPALGVEREDLGGDVDGRARVRSRCRPSPPGRSSRLPRRPRGVVTSVPQCADVNRLRSSSARRCDRARRRDTSATSSADCPGGSPAGSRRPARVRRQVHAPRGVAVRPAADELAVQPDGRVGHRAVDVQEDRLAARRAAGMSASFGTSRRPGSAAGPCRRAGRSRGTARRSPSRAAGPRAARRGRRSPAARKRRRRPDCRSGRTNRRAGSLMKRLPVGRIQGLTTARGAAATPSAAAGLRVRGAVVPSVRAPPDARRSPG